MDAMALGIPTVTFKNNFMRFFDQTDWPPGQWIVDVPELIADCYELAGFVKILERLIDDKDFRQKMGLLCREKALSQRSRPNQMAKDSKNIYEKILTKKISEQSSDADSESEKKREIDCEAYNGVMENRINRLSYESYLFNKKEMIFALFVYKHKYFYNFIKILFAVYKKILFLIFRNK